VLLLQLVAVEVVLLLLPIQFVKAGQAVQVVVHQVME
jgi:hypothetical protein